MVPRNQSTYAVYEMCGKKIKTNCIIIAKQAFILGHVAGCQLCALCIVIGVIVKIVHNKSHVLMITIALVQEEELKNVFFSSVIYRMILILRQ